VSALQVLAAMVDAKKSLRDLLAGMVKLPQVLLNVPLSGGVDLDHPEVAAAIQEVEQALEGRGRLLLRPSGTEPVIRVMVEGDNADDIHRHAQRVADALSRSIN
jgi:phosphoglucosamine mutase